MIKLKQFCLRLSLQAHVGLIPLVPIRHPCDHLFMHPTGSIHAIKAQVWTLQNVQIKSEIGKVFRHFI